MISRIATAASIKYLKLCNMAKQILCNVTKHDPSTKNQHILDTHIKQNQLFPWIISTW